LKDSSRFALTLALFAVLFLALVVLSDTLLRGAKIDLTENQLYTLSDGTREVLADIDEPVNLTFYFSDSASESLPMLRDYAQRVRELLAEFEMYAGGAIRLREVDPEPFSDAEEMARDQGLQGIPLGNSGERLYFGLVGTNAVDEKVLIPYFQVDKEVFLEYDIAQLVHTLSQPALPKVGLHTALSMTAGANVVAGAAPSWMIYQQLESLFAVQALDEQALSDAETLADLDLLILAHPATISPLARYRVEQFLLAGGRLLVFADPLAEGMVTGAESVAVPSPVDELLAGFGIGFDPDKVVIDRQVSMEVAQQDGGTSPDPALLRLRDAQLNQDDIITAQLDQVIIATGGALELLPESTLSMVALMQSTTDSRLLDAQQVLVENDPSAWLVDFVPDAQRYVLAARFSGPLSASILPADLEQDVDESAHIASSQDAVNLVVIADSDLLRDRFWVETQQFLGQRVAQAWANNGDLVVNALDNLSGSDGLISIRTRASAQRPFDRVEAMRKAAGQRLLQAEAQLEQELAQTEQRLIQLQRQQGQGSGLTMSEAQSAEVQRFQQRQRELNRQLRDVRRELDTEIDALGTRLKLLNVLAVPLLLSLVGMVMFWRRYRRGGGR
jgi:ABC-type uncharacterized transport system involved in gliding motility auxiliary subunit